MNGYSPSNSVAQADSAAGSPTIRASPTIHARTESGDDAFMEASSSRYVLYDDQDDESCCCKWGIPFKLSSANEALLSTPQLTTRAVTEPSSLCCDFFFAGKDRRLGVPERVLLPRLSSTFGGLRTNPSTPGGGGIVTTRGNGPSSPSSPERARAGSLLPGNGGGSTASSVIEPFALNGTALPPRPPVFSRRTSESNRSLQNGRSGGATLPVAPIVVVRKIVMLGARNSGKSSVVLRFAEKRFGTSYDPTIETTVRAKVNIRGIHFQCDVLDTAGQDEYSSFSRQATVGVHGYCMVYSITSMQSFLAIQKIHERITNLVGTYTVPTILVGTKCDDERNREVPTALAESLAEAWGASFVECSAKSDFGVDDVYLTLIFEIERDSGLLAFSDDDDTEEEKHKSNCVVS